MLLSLNIKNAALISQLNVDFGKGLNTLSGETGAGKTIIIDSLMFALGSKADKGMIRNGENVMSAEAVFDIAGNTAALKFLNNIGINEETVIIYRTLNSEGKGVISVNGKTVTLSMLKELTSNLIDIYSQSEHISLLKPSTHTGFLDGYGGESINTLKKELERLYQEYKDICSQLNEFGGAAEERQRLIDLYEYQINEIEEAKISENEENELAAELTKLSNVEKISEEIAEAVKLFSEERGINSSISAVKNSLYRCLKYDESLMPLCERIESARLEFDDIYSSLSDYINNLEYDYKKAETTEKRLEKIKDLKRKYGADLNGYLLRAKSDYARLCEGKEKAEKLAAEKKNYLYHLYETSLKLSQERKKAAIRFEQDVIANLNDINMGGSSFKVIFNEFPLKEETEKYITSGGMDIVEFYISTNKGEPLKPLAKIISGGEMSRFMLAIKSILSDTDNVGTLIFDEIDTGISGNTATAVAKKFARIALKHQIIAITHLPQIAAMADDRFLIEKKVKENSSYTYITKLKGEDAVSEVSRLIGAAEAGGYGKLHAEEMINWSDNYKKALKGGV
jgi:DNA repair protein RecN (Recombination protein N)